MPIIEIMKHTTRTLIIIAILILTLLLSYGLKTSETVPEKNNGMENEPASISESYKSQEFNFSLRYPSDWGVSDQAILAMTPAVNVYKIKTGSTTIPLTHHDNETNVSVFPNGIPTEGLFAPAREVDFDPGFAYTADSMLFLKDDGVPFAAYIRPANPPDNWGEAGFIWVRARISNLETKCVDESGETIPEERCDPLTDDHQILWSGTIDERDWEEAKKILRSMEFANS